ncbi:unnamed protein product [Urochloa humidicola]
MPGTAPSPQKLPPPLPGPASEITSRRLVYSTSPPLLQLDGRDRMAARSGRHGSSGGTSSSKDPCTQIASCFPEYNLQIALSHRWEQEVNIEKQPLLRLVVMGKKSLSDPAKHNRPYWGCVELVTTKVEDIKDALKEEEYSTATRGKRRWPAARALGGN